MLSSLPPYLLYILVTLLSAIISAYAVKKTIFITQKKKIYDVPDKIRKIHGAGIPSLGGIGIFTGFILVVSLFWREAGNYLSFLMFSATLLFFTGLYDDLTNMRPSKKLAAQLVASFIMVWSVDMRMDPFFAVFGFMDVPPWLNISVTVLCCTFFINVFNFVDGIDGLACALTILYCGMLAFFFTNIGFKPMQGMTFVLFALIGATAGLLYYNRAPARIYMGDTGSMFLGFTIFSFSLFFINLYKDPEIAQDQSWSLVHGPRQAVVFSFAMLLMPAYDGLRVFVLRALKGISPFKADRTHLHYYLLDAGCTHSQAVFVIVGMNVVTLALAYFVQDKNIYLALAGCILLQSVIVFIIYRLRQRHMAMKSGER